MVATTGSYAMYCKRLRLSVRTRLVRRQTTPSLSDRIIVRRGFSKEETAARAAPVPPEQLANRLHSKRERCSRGISVVRCPRNFLNPDPFGLGVLLPLLPTAMIQTTRRWFLRAHSAP